MTSRVLKRRFTAEEYQEMGRAGILTEDDRVELIEGEIVQMSPIGSRHAACVDRLTGLLARGAGDRAIVRVQNPIRIGKDSEPQPDLTLLRPRSDFYAAGHPTPKDVLLLIEVVASSEDYDRDVKLPVYARAGIAEVWLVDLEHNRIEVFRKPGRGGYGDVTTAGAKLSPKALPDLTLAVADILPSR
jgi:Uma2 family endonuclease